MVKSNRQPVPLESPEKVCNMLGDISLLGGLDDAQLATVFEELQTLHFNKDEIIFEQYSQPTYIYIVLSGRVKILSDYHGTKLGMLVREHGQCFGETSLIGIQPHSVTAITLEPCELLVLSSEALSNLFEKDKTLYAMLILNIAREMSRNLHIFCEHFIEYAMTHQAKSD